MKSVFDIVAWAIIACLLAILVRLILTDIKCDEVVAKHIGDSIPRSVIVSSSADFLTGECSYKTISKNIKVD